MKETPKPVATRHRILVISGTTEGREISALLSAKGYFPLTTTVTAYGAELVREACSAVETHIGALDKEEMISLCRQARVGLVVDASHPYAVEATRNAAAACQETGLPYLRYERPMTGLEHPLVHVEPDYAAAAQKAVALAKGKGALFSAVGARRLAPIVEAARAASVPLIVRILPQVESLERCARLGLQPKEIVALQGPFSYELNQSLLREYEAAVLLTKDGGPVGGTETKVRAALALNVPVVLISRPDQTSVRVVSNYDDLLAGVKKALDEEVRVG